MRRLWAAFTAVIVLSFLVLGWVGVRIYQQAPPIPSEVRASDGRVVVTRADIEAGQNVWQSMGGMEVGSIWGHGSYVAPDWTADWLHRESIFVLNEWARAAGAPSHSQLPSEQQARLQRRLQDGTRRNTYDPATGVVTIDPARGGPSTPMPPTTRTCSGAAGTSTPFPPEP